MVTAEGECSAGAKGSVQTGSAGRQAGRGVCPLRGLAEQRPAGVSQVPHSASSACQVSSEDHQLKRFCPPPSRA